MQYNASWISRPLGGIQEDPPSELFPRQIEHWLTYYTLYISAGKHRAERAPVAASQSAASSERPTGPRYQRSSSAVPYRESPIDVEFAPTVVPLHRPVPQWPAHSAAATPNLGLPRHLANDQSPPSPDSPLKSTSLARRIIGNVFRGARRSKSATNSREASPVK